MSGIDRFAERASRWIAARTSRRSFLSLSGKAALVTVGGVGLTAVLQEQAEARVCGQSGVSPKCPTYDCVGPNVLWGFCWYASPGCCSNGGLKKICDCCGINYPNVHGYCPDGSNVYCVVESCLEDPRVQKVSLDRYSAVDAIEMSMAASLQRPEKSSPRLVVASGVDVLVSAMAVPVAAQLGVPLLLVDASGVRPAILSEFARLGTKEITVIGTGLSESTISELQKVAEVEVITTNPNIAAASVDVAIWHSRRSFRDGAVCVGAGIEAIRLAPIAAAHAAVIGRPLVISPDALGSLRATTGVDGPALLVGHEVDDAGSRFGRTERVANDDPVVVARELADRSLKFLGKASCRITIVSTGATHPVVGLLPNAGVVVAHPSSDIPLDLRDWIIANRKRFNSADLVISGAGALGDQGVYTLQSGLNGFDAHFLTGVDGMGLPVITQPLDERPIGAARVSGLPPEWIPTTVVSSANARRRGPTTTAAVGISPPATPAPRSSASKPAGPSTTTSTTTTSSTTPSNTTTTRPSSTSTSTTKPE